MKKSLFMCMALVTALAAIPSAYADKSTDGYSASSPTHEAFAFDSAVAPAVGVSGVDLVTPYSLGFSSDGLSHSHFGATSAHVDVASALLARTEERPDVGPKPAGVHLYSTYRAKRTGVRFRQLTC